MSELVKHYQEKQAEDRRPKSQPKVRTQSKQDSSVKEMPNKSFSVRLCLLEVTCTSNNYNGAKFYPTAELCQVSKGWKVHVQNDASWKSSSPRLLQHRRA